MRFLDARFEIKHPYFHNFQYKLNAKLGEEFFEIVDLLIC